MIDRNRGLSWSAHARVVACVVLLQLRKLGGMEFPLNIFLYQEIQRLQKVLTKVRLMLVAMQQAIRGEVVMTQELVEAMGDVFDAKVRTARARALPLSRRDEHEQLPSHRILLPTSSPDYPVPRRDFDPASCTHTHTHTRTHTRTHTPFVTTTTSLRFV